MRRAGRGRSSLCFALLLLLCSAVSCRLAFKCFAVSGLARCAFHPSLTVDHLDPSVSAGRGLGPRFSRKDVGVRMTKKRKKEMGQGKRRRKLGRTRWSDNGESLSSAVVDEKGDRGKGGRGAASVEKQHCCKGQLPINHHIHQRIARETGKTRRHGALS